MVAQGIVAFQQRLYDKEKAEEVVNLHQVMMMMMMITWVIKKMITLTSSQAPSYASPKL